MAVGCFDGDRSSHTVADQNRILDPQLAAEPLDVA